MPPHLEEAQRNPFAVTLRYDDLEVNDLTLEETVVVVETVCRWAEEQVVEVVHDIEEQ